MMEMNSDAHSDAIMASVDQAMYPAKTSEDHIFILDWANSVVFGGLISWFITENACLDSRVFRI